MRNRPHFALRAPDRTRGFTLVELITVVVIIAVVAAVAMPDLSNLLVSQRLRAAGTDLMSSLLVARSEAIKRNGPVEVRPVSGVDWTQGWIVNVTSSNQQIDKRSALGASVVVAFAPASIVYQHNGRVSATAISQVQFSDGRSGSALSPRCLVIAPSGVPRLNLGACA